MTTRLKQVFLACPDCGYLLEPHHLACPRCQLILPERNTRLIEPIRMLIEDEYMAKTEAEKYETVGELNVAGLRL